ncbi:MAG: helix-turn-helix transcriptional regulator [Bacteroidales bacterium]|nr:helix-turn-helix transcriptional regulator [Bacteroidales bacterium]MBP5612994.1 helix-turn-helix transcriptional regulator [Bacteroidales bacterium]
MKRCSIFVKEMRRQYGLTQRQLAEKAGVGLRFLRELESDKPTLRMDKVNMVLEMFNAELGVVQKEKNIEQ